MKYIRTKDGRILERDKTDFGKSLQINVYHKKTNKIIETFNCDYVDINTMTYKLVILDILKHIEFRYHHSIKEMKVISTVFNNDEIIKEADTIEELCEEYIWIWNKSEFPYSTARQYERFSGFGDLERMIRVELNYGKNLNTDYQVYGAIWTDKGLIYVAKVNVKGELELL